MVTQIVFFFNMLSQNLASIVACAQMFDSFAGSFWPQASIALRVSPMPFQWVVWNPSESAIPFEEEGEALLITAGYVATAILLAPLGLRTLEENMLQQKVTLRVRCVSCPPP